jgi:hypothetical protein
MKTLLLIFFTLASVGVQAQAGIVWGPEITVSDGAMYGFYRPRATIVNGDTPVVLYGRIGDENVFISRWNGTSFDAPMMILPTGTDAYIANWTGPDIDSRGDTVIAVFKLNPAGIDNVYAVRSIDGGLTFSDTLRVDNHDGITWMASMGMDDNANPIVTYMAHDIGWGNPRYVIANSSDAGVTYNPEMEVITSIPGEACDCCPAEVIVQGQKQVLLFRNNDANIRDIHGVLSLDNGVTFPHQTNIDNLNWSITACPATGPDGVFVGNDLISAYASRASGKYRVYLSHSSASSDLTFNTRTQIAMPDLSNSVQNFPRISGINDTIVMAWEEKEANNLEIFYTVAVPGSDAVTQLTANKWKANATTAGVQSKPEIIYSNGKVHLFFQDGSTGNLIYRSGTIADVTGIDELNQAISIQPNPSNNGEFYISGDIAINSVVNMLGAEVKFDQLNENGKVKLILDHSYTGIYFLSYSLKNGSDKIVKLMVN